MGLTNGVYASCRSFKTVKEPIATLSLVHASIPTNVIGVFMREQQAGWLGEHKFEFAERLPAGAEWPRAVPCVDRIDHPNGGRYIIRESRPGYSFWGRGQADLPVYKECRHRIHGPRALLGSAHTFAPRLGALDSDMPCIDVSRHVNDTITTRWSAMCRAMLSREGGDKVADRLVKVTAYMVSGIQVSAPALAPNPQAWQFISPDLAHAVGLNIGVSLLGFVKEIALKTDPRLV